MAKVKVLKIEAGERTGFSLFHGEGDAVKGFNISFEILSGSGMIYAGTNECVSIPGRQYTFFFAAPSEAAALYALQQGMETANYQAVTKASSFESTTNYGRGETREFDNEQDALEFALNCRECVKESAQYSEPVRTDSSIINLTQHAATAEQVEAGIVEPTEKRAVQVALTFDAIPTASEMAKRAELLSRLSVESGCKKAMIGGAPFFMSALERALLSAGITPVYAFSVRDSIDESDGNGGVRKVNVFRHIGFVEVAQ